MNSAVRDWERRIKHVPFEFLEICGEVRVSVGGDGGRGGFGWGLVGVGPWSFFPVCDLGPYTKEVELLVGEKGVVLETIWILECYNEGGVVVCFVGRGVAHPAWFLCDCEGGIGGVVGSEGTMALLWGPRTTSFAYSDWDAVYEDFGPFDIGPCCEVDWGLCEVVRVSFPQ